MFLICCRICLSNCAVSFVFGKSHGVNTPIVGDFELPWGRDETILFSEEFLQAGYSTPLHEPHILIRRISSTDFSSMRRSMFTVQEECRDVITYA